MTELKCTLLWIVMLLLNACKDGKTSDDSTSSDDGTASDPIQWPIADEVYTTVEQQILPVAVSSDAPQINPGEVSQYEKYGYSAYQVGAGLPYVRRTDLLHVDVNAPNAARLLSFFAITDVHIADKESPAQPIYVGLSAGFGSHMSSAYSPVLLSSTQVLDAAVQTINVLHQRTPFDFGIALGDNVNNAQYNELRWFIDVMDGKVIVPSSGAHAGEDTIDYQMPYQAAGLNADIPWYQVIGNHDQFWMGSSFENAKTLNAHISDTILNMADAPDSSSGGVNGTGFYMGVVDGSTIYGDIVGAGPEADFPTPPKVVADEDRRSLATSDSSVKNWISEFFTTTSIPKGHGFTQTAVDDEFACYSFVPKSSLPLKVIVLDDTCKGENQPSYAVGCLDATRLDWLKSELRAGQDQNQLMIIAAHVPVKPQKDIDDTTPLPLFVTSDFINDDSLLDTLHEYPNLILWIAGHRHKNVVTPQPSADIADYPEQGFWEVETASLRDFPQQFRTFDIRRNTDNTISIVVTNVDTAVTDESPAGKSRGYAVGASRVYASYPLEDTTSHAYNAELITPLSEEMQAIISNYGTPLEK